MSRFLCLSLAVGSLFSMVVGARAQELHYGWKEGSTYAYAIRVESEHAAYTEALYGVVYCTVRSVGTDGIILVCRGSLMPQRSVPREGFQVPPGAPSELLRYWSASLSSLSDPLRATELRIDQHGRILSARGAISAPEMLGNLPRLIVALLSPNGQWEAHQERTIKLASQNPAPAGTGTPQAPLLPASEQIIYKLRGASQENYVLDEQYSLATRETIGGAPRLQVTGSGTIWIDSKLLVPRAMRFAGNLSEQTPNGSHGLPLSVAYGLLENPLTPEQAQPDDLEGASNTPITGPILPKLTTPETTRVLADLKSTERGPRQRACNQLIRSSPNEHREEVAKAVEPLLMDQNPFIRQAAARALAAWGAAENVPALVQALADQDFSVRWAACDALGAIKNAGAAGPLAARLAILSDRARASAALQEIGTAAAPAVIPLLKSTDWSVRLEACHILKTIGARESIPALEEVARQQDGLVSLAAGEAIQAIQKRSRV